LNTLFKKLLGTQNKYSHDLKPIFLVFIFILHA